MNPLVITYVLQALNAIPQLIAAGQNVMAMVQQTRTAVENMTAEKRDPSPEEWAALNVSIDALRKQLHA